MKVTILGCGGSGGVPMVGGVWGNCDPTNPKNRRRRVSILVEDRGTVVLVDTSPDLREQLLDAAVTRLDAILYTHAHGDHCHGIDDLRWLAYKHGGPIDAHATEQTLHTLKRRFDYAFASSQDPSSMYRPMLQENVLNGAFDVGNVTVTPFEQFHGPETTVGFRFGPVAYSTDLVGLPERSFEILDGIELWVVDCLREAPHPTHTHFAMTLEWIARVKPKRAVLTHMNHSVDYDDIAAKCPAGVEPGYDGLVIEL